VLVEPHQYPRRASAGRYSADAVVIWEKLAGPSEVRLLSCNRGARRAIEELFRVGAADLVR
jgi:hypothetical protein